MTLSEENSILKQRVAILEQVVEKQNIQLRFAAGYISATPQFSKKHPMDVLQWIEKESLQECAALKERLGK